VVEGDEFQWDVGKLIQREGGMVEEMRLALIYRMVRMVLEYGVRSLRGWRTRLSQRGKEEEVFFEESLVRVSVDGVFGYKALN
jgi:hypothetical protein